VRQGTKKKDGVLSWVTPNFCGPAQVSSGVLQKRKRVERGASAGRTKGQLVLGVGFGQIMIIAQGEKTWTKKGEKVLSEWDVILQRPPRCGCRIRIEKEKIKGRSSVFWVDYHKGGGKYPSLAK